MAEMASQLAALHAAFFGLYNFDYDRNKSPLLQFEELAAQRQWQLGSNRWKAAYRGCFGIDPPSEEDYRRSQDSGHGHAGEDDDLNPQLANLTLQSANLSTQAPQLGDRAMGQSSASATQLTTQTSFTPARQTIVHSVTPMLQPATLQPANAAVAQSAHPAPVHTGASTTQAQATHPVAQPASSAPMHPTNPLAVKKAQVAAMFTQYYGANASKLDKWQMLCSDCGVDPVPRSITGCKKVSFALLLPPSTSLLPSLPSSAPSTPPSLFHLTSAPHCPNFTDHFPLPTTPHGTEHKNLILIRPRNPGTQNHKHEHLPPPRRQEPSPRPGSDGIWVEEGAASVHEDA